MSVALCQTKLSSGNTYNNVDDYLHRKWRWRHEFKSWIKLNSFHIALIPLGKGMNPIILPLAMGK